jgi:cytochrome c peroxidase
MHDGRFNSLEEVMNHYSDGILITPNTDPEVVNMAKLTADEKLNLVIFLRTLTDRKFLFDKRFVDPATVQQR